MCVYIYVYERIYTCVGRCVPVTFFRLNVLSRLTTYTNAHTHTHTGKPLTLLLQIEILLLELEV